MVEGFKTEYAVQFSDVIVDPSLDQTGLKTFLEEAMPTEELGAALIESIFE